MRLAPIVCVVILSGCVQPEAAQPKVVVKTVIVEKPVPGPTVYVDRPVEKRVYVKDCPQANYCNAGFRTEDACQREPMCEWVGEHARQTGTKVAGYCRNLKCKPSPARNK